MKWRQRNGWRRGDSDCQYSATHILVQTGAVGTSAARAETIFVPPTVLSELRSIPDVATAAVESVLGSWLVERACTQTALLAVVRQSIDPGEAEVIALALELKADDVVLDDLDARRFARRSGLQSIGTLVLLLAAKENGLFNSLRDEIDKLREAGFRASDVLITTVLASAGEQ